jgi:serine/threonine protein kinase
MATSQKLGEGSFASVFKDIRNGKEVAIKQYNKESLINPKSFLIEINILCSLSHPNIIGSYDIIIDQYVPKIILEFGIPLFDIISQKSPHDQLKFIFEIGSGLDILFKYGFLHCDIKQDNIIVVDGIAKLADPGLALKEDSRYKVYQGHADCQPYIYKAPENLIKHTLSRSGEVWAYALLIIEILMWKNEYLSGLKLPKQAIFKRFIQFIKNGSLKNEGLHRLFMIPNNEHDVLNDDIINMLEYDHIKRTRDLSGFLSHQHFINHNLIYGRIKESIKEELWLPIEIDIMDYINCTKTLYDIMLKYHMDFKAFNLTLTLFNALIGNSFKEKYYKKLGGYIIISDAYYGHQLGLGQVGDLFDFRSHVISESIANTVLQTGGITLYQTPYDLAKDYNSMGLALKILMNNMRLFIIDEVEYRFGNIQELCEITDKLEMNLGLNNVKDIINYINFT